jgi:hypothetical protein
MFEIHLMASNRSSKHIGICPNHPGTPRRLNSHPRGIRLFTCQRTKTVSSPNVAGNFRHWRREQLAFESFASRFRVANRIVRSGIVNGVLRIFQVSQTRSIFHRINRLEQCLSTESVDKLSSRIRFTVAISHHREPLGSFQPINRRCEKSNFRG